MRCQWKILAVVTLLALSSTLAAAPVQILRIPDGGIQPQARTDGRGVIHLIYFKGEAAHGDVFYVRSGDGGASFSPPLRVNSQPGSVIAAGSVRGAHLAIGKNGRIHVAWMGSQTAEPRVAGKHAPMLYTRLNDTGDAFEPERNVIQQYVGLDGGGSVAADEDGNVNIAWHAPRTEHSEADRHVWLARSNDEGQTFSPEVAVNPTPSGCCACCGMRIFAGENGRVFILYRSATDIVHRDTHLLVSGDAGRTFTTANVHPWTVGQCMMSTAAFAAAPQGILAAWETQGQIHVGRIAPDSLKVTQISAPPGPAGQRKHPALAANDKGEFILAWIERAGWKRGGPVMWQLFDADGRPVPGHSGRAGDAPAWGLPAVVVVPDGSFRIIL